MRVAIIGGTGFVGNYITDHLLESGHQPVLLVRKNSHSKVRQGNKCVLIEGDVGDSAAIAKLLDGADAVIYNIGILRAFPKKGITFQELQLDAPCRVMDAALKAGIERFILMSANGVKAEGTDYQRTKFMAEQYLASTALKGTVFRPSVIYGDPQGNKEFVSQLMHDIILSPLPAPLFFKGLLPVNAGAFKLAPVHITDVATAFAKAITDDSTIGKTIQLCGPDAVSWHEILQTIADTLGKSKLMIPAPAIGVSTMARFLDGFEFFPVTRDQITMLMEGNTCSENGFAQLQIVPKPFNQQALDYLIK